MPNRQSRFSPKPERFFLHMPVDVRNVSLVVLAILASLFVLQWARAVLIPIMLSVLFSYAFSPLVNWLELRRMPRWLEFCRAAADAFWARWARAPTCSGLRPRSWSRLCRQRRKSWARRSRCAAASQTARWKRCKRRPPRSNRRPGTAPTSTGPNRGATRVVIEAPRFNIKNYLWTGTVGLLALIGQTTVVVFLTYFLMLSGDTFRRKLVKLAGPSLSKKKITLQALHEIAEQIQRYLQVQLLTSVLVGVLTGLALLALGLDNAAVWGVVAGVLNLVPYVGSLITAAASALVAFLQFGSINMALAVGGASVLIHTLVGNLLTPWLTSRASRLSPVAVFMGLLAWGWLWGVWGLLLGIPILMMVKSVCDRIEDLKPIGEFLGS